MAKRLRMCLVQCSRKIIPTPASLPYFPRVWDRRRKVFFTFGGVSSSISDEELRNAVRLGDVFDNRYPEREVLVYLHDRVTYYTKTHQLAFLSHPALPPAPL